MEADQPSFGVMSSVWPLSGTQGGGVGLLEGWSQRKVKAFRASLWNKVSPLMTVSTVWGRSRESAKPRAFRNCFLCSRLASSCSLEDMKMQMGAGSCPLELGAAELNRKQQIHPRQLRFLDSQGEFFLQLSSTPIPLLCWPFSFYHNLKVCLTERQSGPWKHTHTATDWPKPAIWR